MVDLMSRKAKCMDCEDPPEPFVDSSSGDCICPGCGLVLDDHCLDTTAEWREFATDGVGDGSEVHARKRGSGEEGHNVLFEDYKGGTSVAGGTNMARGITEITRKVDWITESQAKKRRLEDPNQASHPAVASGLRYDEVTEGRIQDYLRRCKKVANMLGLDDLLSNECETILQALADKGKLQAGERLGFVTAIVYQAAIKREITRTPQEIALVVKGDDKGQRTTESDRLCKLIMTKNQEIQTRLGLAKTTSFTEDINVTERIARSLKLPKEVIKQVVSACEYFQEQAARMASLMKTEKLPKSAVLAVALFITAHLWQVDKIPSLEEVAVKMSVDEKFVLEGYYRMHPRLRYLLKPEIIQDKQVQRNLQRLPPPAKPQAKPVRH